jgi:hypothetical protein
MKDRTKTARVTVNGGAKRTDKSTNKKSHGMPWLS